MMSDQEPFNIDLKIVLEPYAPEPISIGEGDKQYYIAYSHKPVETKEQRELRQIEQLAEWLINPNGTRNRIDGYDESREE